MSSILHHVLLPMSQAQLAQREAEISQNSTARLLTEGAFLSPVDSVTFYTREIREDGVLRDIFLVDRRNPAEEVIYTANSAYLLGDSDTATVILVDGLAQRLNLETQRLATTNFRDFSFDITTLTRNEVVNGSRPETLTSFAFLSDWSELAERTGRGVGTLAEELNGRIAEPLFCLVAALIGFTTLLVGGYSRFGVWREIGFAFGLLLMLDGARSALRAPVRETAALWPVLYVPVVLGALIALAMLWYVARPRRLTAAASEVPA
jgi:lipopolysaccharide export system permease protein